MREMLIECVVVVVVFGLPGNSGRMLFAASVVKMLRHSIVSNEEWLTAAVLQTWSVCSEVQCFFI